MRLLLGSGGVRTPERVAVFSEQVRSFFGPVRRLLFVPFALADHDAYVKKLYERGLDAGYELDGLHRHGDPVAAVRQAEGLFVGGGNTFRLLNELYRRGLRDVVRECVLGGMPYLGVSAGTNVACPTIKTTNDMPIVQPPSFAALGLVPFQINAHYSSGQAFLKVGEELVEHFGETRDERLREFHEENDTPVIGLWEGGYLRLENRQLTLHGARARLFRKGCEPLDLEPGADLDGLGVLSSASVK